MNKQELIRFLQDEADRALTDIFPIILSKIEQEYEVGGKVSVPLYLSQYPQNIQASIIGTAVKKLEELGYTVTPITGFDDKVSLEVS